MNRALACVPVLLFIACSSSPSKPSSTSPDALSAQPVVWTSLVNATASGNSVVKSGGMPDLDDAGARSKQMITGEGWVEFTVSNPQPFRFVGLASAPGTTAASIDFAVRLQSGRADIYENGQWRFDNTVVTGDVMRLQVSNGVVSVTKNGNALYTHAKVPKFPLYVGTALISQDAAVNGALIGLPLVGAPAQSFVDNLSVQATADGAVIDWTTNVESSSLVEYGATSAYGSATGNGTPVLQHSVTLTGLAAGTYHFRVTSIDAMGNLAESTDSTFTVAAAAGGGMTTTGNRHRFCGWTMATGYVDANSDPGYLTFAQHADEMDAVHPAWYHLASATTFATIYGEGATVITDHTTKNGKRALLIPMVAAVDGSEPGWISTMIKNATQRAQHIANLVSLAKTKGYDGLDLDYEHLPSSDRAAFSQFASELATAMHAAGKELSFAVQADTGTGPHDWVALSAAADHLHVMAYDYHFLGSHLGPTSPLGWVQQLVDYMKTIDGGKRTDKFILGLANYGLAGSEGGTSSWFGNSVDSAALAGTGYATTTTHMSSCAYGSQAPGRAPNAMTSKGRLYFEDLLSLEEKVQLAQTNGLGGITYWTMGGEPSQPGRTWFQMVRSHFPQ